MFLLFVYGALYLSLAFFPLIHYAFRNYRHFQTSSPHVLIFLLGIAKSGNHEINQFVLDEKKSLLYFVPVVSHLSHLQPIPKGTSNLSL